MFFKPAILCIALAAPSIAQAEYWLFPMVYEVVGIADGDALNVRAEPNAGAYDLGDLLQGQQREVTAFDETGHWARVLWHGEDGWVARQFLQKIDQYGDDFSGMPVNLSCSGTEPFWHVEITPNAKISFTEMGGETAWMPIETSTMSRNMYRSNYAFETQRFTGLIRRAECSDGMSDMTYGWALDLLDNSEDDLWSGCCSTILPVVDGY